MTDIESDAGHHKLERRIGMVLFVCVFLFYFLLAPTFSVPGRWAGIAAVFSGLDPFRQLIRPVWSALTAALAALPIGNIGYAYNILTSLTGAAVCWLLFEIVRRIPYERTFRRGTDAREEREPRIIAGLACALFAAFSNPLLVFATRGDYAVFDAFILLLALYPAMLYVQNPSNRHLFLSCFFMGLALIEYPTALMVFPAFLLGWAYLLWRKGLDRKPRNFIFAALMLLSGCLVLVFYAGLYAGTSQAVFRGFGGLFDVIVSFARLYYFELTRSVPRVGWLLIIGMNLIPFFVVLFRQLDEPEDIFSALGVYSFRLVLFGLAVLALFELPGSPAYVIGRQNMLLAPALIVAAWSGFLVGYYARLLSHRSRTTTSGRIVGLLWLLVLVAAGIRHGTVAGSDHLRPVVAFADTIIGNLKGRNFIITDGSMDPSLRLAARQAGAEVNLINIQTGVSAEHGRYYASMFDTPDYKALAMLGPVALLRDWLTRAPDAPARSALLASPELIRFPGIQLLPDLYYYAITRPDHVFDPVATFTSMKNIWSEWSLPGYERVSAGDAGWFQLQFVTRWMSRLANDLGCELDDASYGELAIEAYRQSLKIWPDNMSALLNQREQALRSKSGQAEVLQEMIDRMLTESPELSNVRYVYFVCGLVRNPYALLARLTASGQAGLQPDDIASAAKLLEVKDDRALVNIARLHLRGTDPDESESIYLSLLATNPDNLDALYGMFHVSMLRRDLGRATEYLDRMKALGVEDRRLALDRAAMALAAGEIEKARRLYGDMVKEVDVPSEAWLGLLNIAIREKDEDVIETAFSALDRDRNYLPGQFMLGERALMRRDPVAARNYFERVISVEPQHESALVRLLQIAFGLRDVDAIRRHSAAMLVLRPDNPFANFMSAYIHIDAGDYLLAEAALRRSLAVNEDGAALNELAYVLSKLGRYEEAREVALRAVEKSPRNYNAWDTLAGIKMKLGARDQALESIAKAMELEKNNDPFITLHAAEIYAEAGEDDRARELMETLDTSVPAAGQDDFKVRKMRVQDMLRK